MAFVIDFTVNEFFESFMFLVRSFCPFVVISFHRNRFLSTFVLFSFILVFFLFFFLYYFIFYRLAARISNNEKNRAKIT